VSLIESALEKLRRVGEPGHDKSLAVARAANAPASAPKAAPVVVPPAREYIHRRIAIDTKALRSAGYLPDVGLERRFADHYRQIKRPLIDKAFSGGAEMRLIVISSALPGDGKTFTTINLALSMARERDVSVLLVDADAPKARTSEVLGLRRERGLLDALVDESLDVESLIVQTDVRGLELLPAGKLIESAPELIASARMDQIAARLSARNPRQIILFDSAPLLVSSEARTLLRVPGQVVLVVRVGVTPRQAAIDALAHIDKKKLQGLILNQATFSKVGGYYGYPTYGESVDDAHGAR
jgi:protein-tyrosine kinase